VSNGQSNRSVALLQALAAGGPAHPPGTGRRQRRAAETRIRLFRCALQLFAQRDAKFAARFEAAKAAYHAEFAAALDELVQRYRLRPALGTLPLAIGLYALWCGFAVQRTTIAAAPRGEMLLAFFRAVTGAASPPAI